MSRHAVQSSNWNYQVNQERLTHKGSDLAYYGNFRADNNACLGITTEKYGLAQNADLMDAARGAFDLRGLTGYSEKITVIGEGQRMYAEFTFANKQLATDVGDIFGYKLILKNSFDGSLRAAFALGFLRLTCKNGASTMEKEFSLNQKHNSKINVSFVAESIEKALSKGTDAIKVYDQLASVELSDEEGLIVLRNLEERKVLTGSLRENIRPIWLNPRRDEDKARNLYNLYNAISEHLTHVTSVERYEYAEKVNSNAFLSLVTAARDEDKMRKLLTAPVVVSEAATVIDVEIVNA